MARSLLRCPQFPLHTTLVENVQLLPMGAGSWHQGPCLAFLEASCATWWTARAPGGSRPIPSLDTAILLFRWPEDWRTGPMSRVVLRCLELPTERRVLQVENNESGLSITHPACIQTRGGVFPCMSSPPFRTKELRSAPLLTGVPELLLHLVR